MGNEKNKRKPLYDSEEDRRNRTKTKSVDARLRQEEAYRDASASPAERRDERSRRRKPPVRDKDVATGKIKGERESDLARLKAIADRQKAETTARASMAGKANQPGRSGGGRSAVRAAMGLTGPNPFARRLAKGGFNGKAIMKARGGTFKGTF